jgi:hypothetical protein
MSTFNFLRSVKHTKTLSLSDPICQKLFRPFILSDFKSPGKDKRGEYNSPLVSQNELKWLRTHSLLFGLDPSKLNLPELNEPERSELMDKRILERIARQERLRREKQDRIIKRLAKTKTKKVFQEPKTEDEKIRKLPTSLRPTLYREEYMEDKLKTVSQLMAGMDEKVKQWRQRRKEGKELKKKVVF